jgi:subtilase family serine protease
MRNLPRLVFAVIGIALGLRAEAAPLITTAIDESRLVALPGNVRPEANPANDRGPVAPDLLLEHMQLQLRRSPEDEAAAARLVEALQDRHSPLYHHWLGAAEFGARFGADEGDLAQIRLWLEGHGLTVNSVYPNRLVMDFTGTAAQVEAAFHTPIHALDVGGEHHIAAMADPKIPAALVPVVAGVATLHDFHPHNKHRPHRRFASSSGCFLGPCYAMGPADLATIYDLKSLFAAGITGAGQQIAVVEDTDLYTVDDFTTFRQIFGLDKFTAGNLVTLHPAPPKGGTNCRDPGVNQDGDDVEAALDVEWSSATAPDATIILAACNNTQVTDGVYLAIANLVNGATPPDIISVSYGNCEAENGAAYNEVFDKLYQQAAAEGISVFVATGDDGATDCTYNASYVTLGIGVNAWAATQYNTAVGGTDFQDTILGQQARYWTATPGTDFGSARSYVPEIAWNDSCTSPQVAKFFSLSSLVYGASGFCSTAIGQLFVFTDGGEGGPSACFYGTPSVFGVVGGTCRGYPKPSWQAAYGVPRDGVRDLPDVSMFAADGIWDHDYLLCYSDPAGGGAPCTANPGDWPGGGGGTSYATPITAGIQALVNQHVKGRQGNPAPVYYELAGRQFGLTGKAACNASLGKSIAGTCVFHDVTVGTDAEPCRGQNDCFHPGGAYGILSRSDTVYQPAFEAHLGYDFPTGIGTIDAANLVAAWPGQGG